MRVVHVGRAVDRDHDLVDRSRDRDRRAGASSRPVVTSVMRMPSVAQPVAERPEVAVQQRLAAGQHHPLHVEARGSPRRGDRARRRSISRLSAFAFQMSHITQRQLQALWTLSARIGSDSSRCVRASSRAGRLGDGHHQRHQLEAGLAQAGALATRRATQRASRRDRRHRRALRAYGCRRAANTARIAVSPTSGPPPIIVSRTSARVAGDRPSRTGRRHAGASATTSAGAPAASRPAPRSRSTPAASVGDAATS